MLRSAFLVAVVSAALALSSCGGPDNSTPEGAVKNLVATAQKDDLKAVIHLAMAPAALNEAKANWDKQRFTEVDDKAKAQFAMAMTQLTAANAEETLFLMLKPQLAQMQHGLPMLAQFITTAGGGIATNDKLSAQEKLQAQQAMNAFGAWLNDLKLTDETKAKQAIAIACAVARNAKIQNLDQLRALNFDSLLDKVGPAYVGLLRIFAIYGMDAKATMASVLTGDATITGATAKVPVSYMLLGKSMTTTMVLEKVGEAWFPTDNHANK